jgi:hypothetical protein
LQVHSTQAILIVKTKVKEEILHSKVRVVVQGKAMREKIDYDSTFALVAYMSSIRLLIIKTCHIK